MPDDSTPPVTTTAAPVTRGYFNKAQSAKTLITRIKSDNLLHVLNTRRSSIQHAADAIWPWNNEAHRPIRKTFALPLTRPMGM